MKTFKLFILLFLLFITFLGFAQGIEITSGGNITAIGLASIQIDNGSFTNNGTYTKGTETITMSGSTAKLITGNSSTDVNNLIISNTGGITTELTQLTSINLSIANGSKFTIIPEKSVQVNTLLTNNAGVDGLIIKSSANVANGSLIFNNPEVNPVLATVEMYSKAVAINTNPYSNYKWQYFGIPLRSLATASPTFNGSYVRKYYETAPDMTNLWISLNNGSSLSPLDGYEITQPTDKTIYFQGELVNTNQSKTLTYTSNGLYKGNHILSNPFTAAIDIRNMSFGANMENTVYLYNTGSHDQWVANVSSTNGNNAGQYSASTPSTAGTTIEGYSVPLQIPSMQGFLVKNTAETTFILNYNSLKMNNTAPQRVKSNVQESDEKVFTLVEVKGARFSDQLWLFNAKECSHNFDNGWDAHKYFGSGSTPQLYAAEQDGDYQINAVDNLNQTVLGFRNGEDDKYVIRFFHKNINEVYPNLYLFDLLKNTSIDISKSGTEYEFEANPTTDATKRFKILTSNESIDNLNNFDSEKSKIYCEGKTIVIDNKTNFSGQYCIYDMLGRIVLKDIFEANKISSHTTNLMTGSYIVVAKNESMDTTVKIIAN